MTACSKTNLFYEKSDEMAADIYTKAFTCPFKWQDVSTLINHWIIRAAKGSEDGKVSYIQGLKERVQIFQAELDEKGTLHKWRAPPEPQPEEAGPEDSVWPAEIDVTKPNSSKVAAQSTKKGKKVAAASWSPAPNPMPFQELEGRISQGLRNDKLPGNAYKMKKIAQPSEGEN